MVAGFALVNVAYVWDLLADAYVPVNSEGEPDIDAGLAADEIPPHLADELYDEGADEGT